MRRSDGPKRAKADTWTRNTCRIAALTLLLCSTGCSSFITKVSNGDSLTAKAFVFGGVVAGAPVAVAALPLSIPVALNTGGRDGLFLLAAPGIPTFVAGGLAVAAPVAVLDVLIGMPIRALRRRMRGDEDQPRVRPRPTPANRPPPPAANGRLPRKRAPWAPKPPPRLRLRAGAGPPICEPEVQRDIERGIELERKLIPLRKGG